VTGARDLGLNADVDGSMPDLSRLRSAVDSGQVTILYVLDPGPSGSLGDVTWIVAARESGRLPVLIVQGALHSELTAAADFVLAGSTAFEKDGVFTNDRGRVQGAAGVIAPPGDAQDDCLILASFGMLLGLTLPTRENARVEIASELAHLPAYEALRHVTFGRPVAVRTWLQMSNPSERWKWDVLFQDNPPFKGEVDPTSLPFPPKHALMERSMRGGGPPSPDPPKQGEGVIKVRPVD
jgi:predicted molibdopterin-dependent oxidoreductase YjgC